MPSRKPRLTVTASVKPSSFWGVMKAHGVRNVTCGGIPATSEPEGPHFFIPLFKTREQAVAWTNGDEQHIARFSSYLQ